MATPASATTQCDRKDAYIGSDQWLRTVFSYTNISQWSGYTTYPYTGERERADGTLAYWIDKTCGGIADFNNGTTSPWRRTNFHNWYASGTRRAIEVQSNSNGSC